MIIGGAACRAVLADGPVTPRKTVDIDMVLVLEKLDRSFISAFWSFIKAGGYKCAKRKDQDGNPKYVLYSFVGGQEDYPSQVELLSRPVDGLGNPEDHHIEIIDMVEDYSHLSAIILDTDYYNYLIEHSEVKGGLRYASADSLICLKVLAYLNLKREKEAGNHVNDYDFRRIVCDEERLTFTKFNQMHEESLSFIKQAIAASTASKKIVVTHHLPSNLLVAERFRGSLLNGAFVSEQGNWIAESDIDYWIYGHSHTNIDDVIGSTVCVSNQLGYVDYNGMPESDFDPGKIISLI